MKVSQIEKAIATFEAEIAMLQKCVKQLRDQQPWRVAKPARVRKAKKADGASAATDQFRRTPG